MIRTCCDCSRLLCACERQRGVQRSSNVCQRSNAVPTAAKAQCALLEVKCECNLALALVEAEHWPGLALVPRSGATAGLGNLLPI